MYICLRKLHLRIERNAGILVKRSEVKTKCATKINKGIKKSLKIPKG
jgi:hypothetical protein